MMTFVSTRGAAGGVTLSRAILDGIAPDGGLYVPARLPALDPDAFPADLALTPVAKHLLRPFAAGDPLEAHIDDICEQTFTFPAPVVPLDGTPGPSSVLELFHGPTSAFKDFGARFLGSSLERIHRDSRTLTILVATSGDTGGAVAAAFHRKAWADIVLLYPRGLVSPTQAQQLACWGDNVRTFAVAGTFDDCQRMVKEAFQDPALSSSLTLSSANSINIGRLLPQMVYYAAAAVGLWRAERRKPNVIIPTGNLGNAAACVLAREMGLPIGDIVLATNENRTIPDYFGSGVWQPRPSVATLASAMDVGDPSNMERIRWLFPTAEEVRARLSAHVVSDDEIRATIRRDAGALGHVWCPHTATAAAVYRRLAGPRAHEHWTMVATAHPAKFREIIEPLIGSPVAVPSALEALLRRPRREKELAPTLGALRGELDVPGS